jgi:pseudouridine-5'-monophosphatase
MHEPVRGVIFDLDGLLIDSEPVQLRAWEEYLAGHGHQLNEDLLARMYGRRLIDASTAVVEMLALEIDAATVATERDELFLAMVPGAIGPMPGAEALLRDLTERRLPLALATSGHRRYVDLVLDTAGVPRVFSGEVTGEMVKRGKPAPDTFLVAADMLGLPPSACLVLEDSPNGVRAAKASGAYCIGITHHASKEALAEAGADLVLDSLDQVLAALDAQPWLACASQG